IKPDISIYHDSLNGPIPTGCNSSTLDMHIEFKWYNFNNPFPAPPPEDWNQATFLGSSKNQKDTLGQIRAYAAVQLASQFRMHTFSLYVLHDTAHIIQWDREGAIITEPILYNVDPLLTEF
ncbi:hypothetical protein EDC04DRAFT_2495705, partial [Pisolithus marmoratus]